ncbi:iron chelate uptake ABC transporter family permease subunit [Actinokineospora soli]
MEHPARLSRPLLLAASVVVLVVLCALSIMVGSKAIPLPEVYSALVHPTGGETEAIVRGLRLPRTLLGLFAGIALGLAGALMQGLARNPLADPGLLGVSAGAGFAVALALVALGLTSFSTYIWFAFAGALGASVAVYLLGSAGRGGANPVPVAIAGLAVLAVLTSLTTGVLMLDGNALYVFRYWAVGSLTGHDTGLVVSMLPFLVAGVVLALAVAAALNSLALGDDVATALGRRVGLVRLGGVLAVMLVAGTVAAVVGPIVFIGLVIPHLARAITGPDHRWLFPFAMVLAPSLVLAADILGRVVARPGEIGVGVVTAFLGAPFFIALIRRRRLAEL